MRIIAGLYKGRKLYSPKGTDIRPTSDKVKEALFSMLIPYMKESFTAVDLFAGSGSLGLEALSRGAGRVFFSDSSRDSIALIKQNIKLCGVEEKSVLLLGDFKANLSRIKEEVDIFLLDPPYAEDFLPAALRMIAESGKLSKGGVIACEHGHGYHMPEELCGFRAVKDRRYGAAALTLYMKEEEV